MAEFDITAQITSMLKNYTQEVTEDVKQACRDVSKEMTENIKNDSPVRKGKKSGSYKKGWRTKVAYESRDNIRLMTYNLTDYQLTHLLERGHAKRNGGRVSAIPHIQPNEEKAIKELEKRIERAVKK